ncbi:hypothetical protein [Agreia sp. COWG]|uniref:hypothetical protein n=1 Tax=Agreia sp. COWG TaxID=2773266 RepID=UPI00192889C3|nr:hypothetical protein [Agreia sp. COWG]CAD5999055.1 protein of unknown function [Agreia sp. COWG]
MESEHHVRPGDDTLPALARRGVESLDLVDDEWTVVTSAMISRPAPGPDGQSVYLDDAVLTPRRA